MRNETSKCNQCGFNVDNHPRFCPMCGNKTEKENFPAPQNIQSDSINKNPMIALPGEFIKLIMLTIKVCRFNIINFMYMSLVQAIPYLILVTLISLTISKEIYVSDSSSSLEINTSLLKEKTGFIIIVILPFIIINILAHLVSHGAMLLGTAQYYSGEKIDTVKCLNYSFSRLYKLVGLYLVLFFIFIIPIIASAFLIGIPILLYLLPKTYGAAPSIMLENTTVSQSIRTSWDVVKNKGMVTLSAIILLFILLCMFELIGSLLLGAVLGDSWIANVFTSSLFVLLTRPLWSVSNAIYYMRLREVKSAKPI